MTQGAFDPFHYSPGKPSGGLAAKAAGIERTDLEAKEDCFHRKAAFGWRNTHIRWVVARHIFAFRSNNHRNDQWQPIDGVNG